MSAGGDNFVTKLRLKRENFARTKHDSHFSKWKILVGPSDWEDYSLGKEGVSRYRLHNLPETLSPGIYELGIAVSHTNSGREVGKLDPAYIVVVYLGQADSVRSRLQQYGRSGAHLGGNSAAAGSPDDCRSYLSRKGPGLFGEILSKGYSVVYRWAPMKSKEVALKTETQLLNTFDYAWNKGSNGIRRPDDIIQKLNKVASIPYRFAIIRRKLMPLIQKQAGVKIEAAKLESSGSESGISNLLNQVFKFSRSQPRLVQDRCDEKKDTNICGVVLGNGSLCREPPVKGRKRCREHKGMKIGWLSSTVVTVGRSDAEKGADTVRKQEFNCDEDKPQQIAFIYPASNDFTPICGAISSNGTPCGRQPVKGRKRCIEHKGMRIRGASFSSSTVVAVGRSDAEKATDTVRKQEFKCDEDKPQQIAVSHPASNDFTPICGAMKRDGTSCGRQPVQGRKRCAEHKGMRIRGASFSSLAEKKPSNLNNDQPLHNSEREFPKVSLETFVLNKNHNILCGVDLGNGSFCMRQPVKRRVRCEEHKGMRVKGLAAISVGKHESFVPVVDV